MYRLAANLLIAFLLAGAGLAQETPEAPQAPAAPKAAPAPRARPRPYRSNRAPAAYLADEDSRRAYLGVDVANLSSDRAADLKLKDDNGVEIIMLDGDSPAAKAGLREHDVVTTLDGKPIQDSGDLQRAIRAAGPGKTVTLGVLRNGQPLSLKATLADRHDMMSDMHIDIPAMHIMVPRVPEIPSFVMMQSWRRSGIQVENLNTQLGEFFGVKNGEGVLVRSVDHGSRAEQGGLKAGDVIVKVAGARIVNTEDFMRAMRDSKGGNVPMSVIRDRREQTLSVNLPPSGPGDGSEMRDLEITIPSEEWAASAREWGDSMREALRDSARQWRYEMKQHQKEWKDQQKQWEKEWRKNWEKDRDHDWDRQ